MYSTNRCTAKSKQVRTGDAIAGASKCTCVNAWSCFESNKPCKSNVMTVAVELLKSQSMLTKAVSIHVPYSLYHEWQLVASMNVLAKLKCSKQMRSALTYLSQRIQDLDVSTKIEYILQEYKSIFLTVITNHKCDSDFS